MPVDTKKEEEKTASEKISQSSGDETVKYAQTLEEGADKIIDQINEQKEEIGKKAEEKVDELNKDLDKEGEAKKAEEEGKKTEEKPAEEEEKKTEVVEDEIKVDESDTVDSLKDKLTRSEKRVQDNRTAFTKNKQELSKQEITSQAVVANLNKTIIDLQAKVTEKSTAESTEEKKTADKEVEKELVNLDKQFEILKNVDPDIAAPIKQIIKSIQDTYSGKITNLESELKNKTASDEKTAQQTADDLHFGKLDDAHKGWEANIIGTPEFETYIEGLSPRQKVLARQDLKTGSAENIIEIFDDYKVVAGITEKVEKKEGDPKIDAKTKKLKAAQNLTNPILNKSKEIKTEGVKIKYTRSMIQAMQKNPAEFAKHEADIDIEIAAGRVPDDT